MPVRSSNNSNSLLSQTGLKTENRSSINIYRRDSTAITRIVDRSLNNDLNKDKQELLDFSDTNLLHVTSKTTLNLDQKTPFNLLDTPSSFKDLASYQKMQRS